MLGEDRHTKRFRRYQSYLLLVLVLSLILQIITFVVEMGFQLFSLGANTTPPLQSWHSYYILAIILLFITTLSLTVTGIKGTTNESYLMVITFAIGILVTFGVKVILHIILSDYRLAILFAINLLVNAIAIIYALVFAKKMVSEIKDEPLRDSLE